MGEPQPVIDGGAPDPAAARRAAGAAVLAIGNELLSGKVRDLNVAFFIEQLRELGMPLLLVQIIPDVPAVIAETVAWARDRYEVVFTTGGVGPTHDDVTVEAVAAAFAQPLVRSEVLHAGIAKFYRGQLTDGVLRMALIPEGAILEDANGLAVPCVRVDNVWIFPGEPNILRRKFLAIRERFRRDPFHLRRIRLRCEEPEIASFLLETERRIPAVSIGSYPRYDAETGHEVTVTLETKDGAALTRAVEHLLNLLPEEKIIEGPEAGPVNEASDP